MMSTIQLTFVALMLGQISVPAHHRAFVMGELAAPDTLVSESCGDEAWFQALELSLLHDRQSNFFALLENCSFEDFEAPSYPFSSRFEPFYLHWFDLRDEAAEAFGIQGQQSDSLLWLAFQAELGHQIVKMTNQSGHQVDLDNFHSQVKPWYSLWHLLPLGIGLLLFVRWFRLKRLRRQVSPEHANHSTWVSDWVQQVNSGQFSGDFPLQLAQLELDMGLSPLLTLGSGVDQLSPRQQLIAQMALRDFTLEQTSSFLSISKGHLYNERSVIRKKLGIPDNVGLDTELRRLVTNAQQ